MHIELLIYVLAAFSLLVLVLLFFNKGKGSTSANLVRDELQVLRMELTQSLAEARKESSENLHRQFQLISDNQRAAAREQNEAMHQFGERVRRSLSDLSTMQRDKLSELSRRQDELLKNTEQRLEKIREMMEAVVEHPSGTGRKIKSPHYRIAGKTGTAHKFEKNHWVQNSYYTSFAGFFPSDAPKYSAIVIPV